MTGAGPPLGQSAGPPLGKVLDPPLVISFIQNITKYMTFTYTLNAIGCKSNYILSILAVKRMTFKYNMNLNDFFKQSF